MHRLHFPRKIIKETLLKSLHIIKAATKMIGNRYKFTNKPHFKSSKITTISNIILKNMITRRNKLYKGHQACRQHSVLIH